MSNDKLQNGVGAAPAADLADDALLNAAAAEKSEAEIAAEEAKAEEEFISTPEDTVQNPLVPKDPALEAEEENRLEGAIGSGNLQADFPEEKPEPASNEVNAVSTAEPVAEAAPVAEPAAPVAEPTVAEVAAQADGAAKKKSKKGLVITLIIVFLLLIGAGVGLLVWFMISESPENMLKDALSKVIEAENIQTTATIEVDADGQKTSVSLDSVMAGADISGSGSIKTQYNGVDITLNFAAAYSKDGAAYFKFEGLKDSLKGLYGDTSSSDEDDEYGLGALATLISNMLGAIVEGIEGDWYKVTASDLKGALANEQMSCVLENLKSVNSKDTKKKIAEAFGKHQFIKVDGDKKIEEKDGVKFIVAKSDEAVAKEFAKELENIDGIKNLKACFDTETSEESEESKTSDSEITFGIKPWSHELVELKAKGTTTIKSNAKCVSTDGFFGDTKCGDSETKTSTTMSAKLSYDKKEATIPGDAKSIDDMMTSIESSVKTAMSNYVSKMCTSMYGSYGSLYVEACKTEAMSQMGDLDISSLLGGLNLGGSSSISL